MSPWFSFWNPKFVSEDIPILTWGCISHDETGEWENVDDFRWLRAVQSPNWSILPPSERVSVNETDVADRTTSNSSRKLNS
jgi:hypothetical protein